MNNDNFAENSKTAAGTAESSFGNFGEDSSPELKSTAKKVCSSVKDAFGNVQNSVESVKSNINDKPVQSTLIALGIGFVMGRLIGI